MTSLYENHQAWKKWAAETVRAWFEQQRRRPESNRRAGLCRPLPNHSATSPEENPPDSFYD